MLTLPKTIIHVLRQFEEVFSERVGMGEGTRDWSDPDSRRTNRGCHLESDGMLR